MRTGLSAAWLGVKLFVLLVLADSVATTILYQNY